MKLVSAKLVFAASGIVIGAAIFTVWLMSQHSDLRSVSGQPRPNSSARGVHDGPHQQVDSGSTRSAEQGEGASDGARVDSETSETLGLDRYPHSAPPQNVPDAPAVSTATKILEESVDARRIGEIDSHTIQRLVRDCPGANILDCSALTYLAKRIAQSPGDVEDGWSDWMEGEIKRTLSSVALANHFSEATAKCNAEGCILLIASRNSTEMFERGFEVNNEFDRWLRRQPWNDELAEVRRASGRPSTLAWRIIGTDSQPFVTWYVVRRKN
jgi:hypothetical protein